MSGHGRWLWEKAGVWLLEGSLEGVSSRVKLDLNRKPVWKGSGAGPSCIPNPHLKVKSAEITVSSISIGMSYAKVVIAEQLKLQHLGLLMGQRQKTSAMN